MDHGFGIPRLLLCCLALSVALPSGWASADSVNSPNIVLDVDANRRGGAGAGDVAVAVNTITLAETQVGEYSAGAGRMLSIGVRPGFQLDPDSQVSAVSTTFGINGTPVGSPAILTPTGSPDEILTWTLTSGGNPSGQDVIKVSGIQIRIVSTEGAAGPARSALQLSTVAIGGAFTDQGIVAATIRPGAPDHLVFSTQPASGTAGADLLPVVSVVDFGGNVVAASDATISLVIEGGPDGAVLRGATTRPTVAGVATWEAADHLQLTVAGAYTLQAKNEGPAFLSSDTVDSGSFDVAAAPPDHLVMATQPVDTRAGNAIAIAVVAEDRFDNPITTTGVPITLGLTSNPTRAALLTATSLTKPTVEGLATWDAADGLRIVVAGDGYRISASGAGTAVASDPFNVTAALPIPLKVVQVRPGRRVQLVAKGPFALPDRASADPRVAGGSLEVSGTTGSVTYALPAAGWIGLGPNGDGSAGFQFSGGPCASVIVTARAIKAVCRDETGTLALPEPGPVDVVLGLGTSAVYCGQCGVTPRAAAEVFKRTDCAAPAACP
jgi:hypothetical protein